MSKKQPIFIRVFLICTLFAIFCTCLSCKSITTSNNLEYKQTENDIDNILKHDTNLTPAQKIVLKHAKNQLAQAAQNEKKIEKLQNDLIKESKQAGAGKMVYTIIYFVVFLIIAYVVIKVGKKFGLF